jgi:DNA-binding NarL/FixJ family response regulator
MDALKVFYQIRHDQGVFDALLTDLRFVFASGCVFQAMAVVHSQCGFVIRHKGHRPAGREETGRMLGSVTTKWEALELCATREPEILITYDELEDASGIDLVTEARQRWPQLKILLILQHTTAPRLRQALQAGSNGILCDALIAEGHILTAIQTVLAGEKYLDPGLARLLRTSEAGFDPPLSERQLLIMASVAEGLSDREISAGMGIPYDTVRYQLKQVYRALNTTNRCHACLILLRLGLLQMPPLKPGTGVTQGARQEG